MIDSFIENTNRAETKEAIYQLFKDALQNLGYDRFIYCYATDQPKLNRKAEFGIVTTYPEEWTTYYNQSNFMEHDPVVKHLFKADGPFAWDSIIQQEELTKVQSKIMHEANDFQLSKGEAVAIHGRFGGLSGVGVARSYDKEMPNLDALRKIDALTRQFHLAYSDHNKGSNKKLSLRKRTRNFTLGS